MTTERDRATRRPGPAIVIWSSVALFAILFALLTYRVSASRPPAPRPVVVRKVLKKRVVTTVVPGAGRDTVSAGGAVGGEAPAAGYAPLTTGAS